MSTDRYDDEPRDGPRRASTRDIALSKVSTPGMVLLAFGLLGIFIEVAALGLAFSNPTFLSDMMKGMIDSQPPGPARDKMQKDFKEGQEAQMRLDTPMNIGSTVIGLLINTMMFIGGVKMRSLSGYPLALIGAICGIIPIGGCSCCAMPIGIWALIVLLNTDVKAAFAMGSSRGPDRSEEGWGETER